MCSFLAQHTHLPPRVSSTPNPNLERLTSCDKNERVAFGAHKSNSNTPAFSCERCDHGEPTLPSSAPSLSARLYLLLFSPFVSSKHLQLDLLRSKGVISYGCCSATRGFVDLAGLDCSCATESQKPAQK